MTDAPSLLVLTLKTQQRRQRSFSLCGSPRGETLRCRKYLVLLVTFIVVKQMLRVLSIFALKALAEAVYAL